MKKFYEKLMAEFSTTRKAHWSKAEIAARITQIYVEALEREAYGRAEKEVKHVPTAAFSEDLTNK